MTPITDLIDAIDYFLTVTLADWEDTTPPARDLYLAGALIQNAAWRLRSEARRLGDAGDKLHIE